MAMTYFFSRREYKWSNGGRNDSSLEETPKLLRWAYYEIPRIAQGGQYAPSGILDQPSVHLSDSTDS